MNVQQLRSLKQNNVSAYRALAAVAMMGSNTKNIGSPATQKSRSVAFGDAYKGVKAALVGHQPSFWVNEKYLLNWHKFDRKVEMLRPYQRSRAARKALRRIAASK